MSEVLVDKTLHKVMQVSGLPSLGQGLGLGQGQGLGLGLGLVFI